MLYEYSIKSENIFTVLMFCLCNSMYGKFKQTKTKAKQKRNPTQEFSGCS